MSDRQTNDTEQLLKTVELRYFPREQEGSGAHRNVNEWIEKREKEAEIKWQMN